MTAIYRLFQRSSELTQGLVCLFLAALCLCAPADVHFVTTVKASESVLRAIHATTVKLRVSRSVDNLKRKIIHCLPGLNLLRKGQGQKLSLKYHRQKRSLDWDRGLT